MYIYNYSRRNTVWKCSNLLGLQGLLSKQCFLRTKYISLQWHKLATWIFQLIKIIKHFLPTYFFFNPAVYFYQHIYIYAYIFQSNSTSLLFYQYILFPINRFICLEYIYYINPSVHLFSNPSVYFCLYLFFQSTSLF